MNKTQDFTKGVIWKQLLFFFFPILIGKTLDEMREDGKFAEIAEKWDLTDSVID